MKPRALRTLAAALAVAVTLAALPAPSSAADPTPILHITKSGPIVPVNTGDWIVFTLNYRCASITAESCAGVTITDVIQPPLSTSPADVQPGPASHDSVSGYDPATRTVTWQLTEPVSAGTAGTTTLRVRFPPGSTPDGAQALNRARIEGANAPPALSAPVTVTARARNRAYADKALIDGGVPGIATSYYVQVCQPAGSNRGGLDLLDVTLRDVLPAGAELLDATGSYSYDPATRTITWAPLPALAVSSGPSCYGETVTLRYPSSGFAVGDTVRNDLVVTGTPVGAAEITLTDFDIRPLQPPGPGGGAGGGTAFLKEGPRTVRVGETARYSFSLGNTGTAPLDNVSFVDPIPAEMEVTRVYIGTNNQPAGTFPISVEYTTNLDPGWRAIPGSPFATPPSASVAASTFLVPGERITSLRWSYGTLPYRFSSTADPRSGFDALVLAAPLNEIVVNSATLTYTYGGVTTAQASGVQTRVIPPIIRPAPSKSVSPGSVDAGAVVTYTLTVDNPYVAPGITDDLRNPVLADLLLPQLTFIPGSETVVAAPAGAPAPTFEAIPDYAGTGRTLLRWSWAYDLPVDEQLVVRFQARVAPDTASGSLGNTGALAGLDNPPAEVGLENCQSTPTDDLDLDGDGNTTETICTSQVANVVLQTLARADSEKWVRGARDAAWTRYPDSVTIYGAPADYQLTVKNPTTVPLDRLVIVDILPFVGTGVVTETGVVDLQWRRSEWRPFLVGPITPPAGATVFYSTEKNPCRSDFTDIDTGLPEDSPPGCTGPTWSTVPPDDITTVQSVKIDFGARVLQPGDVLTFEWPMRAPLGPFPAVPPAPGEIWPAVPPIAWNSFGLQARRVDTGALLYAVEPIKVGIERVFPDPVIYGDYAWHDDGDGIQEAGEPGVNGVRVELYSAGPDAARGGGDDALVGSTTTGPDDAGTPGWYLFGDLPTGFYYARFMPPPGYSLAPTGQGDADTDSDAALDGFTPVTELTTGEIDRSWDVGLVTATTAAVGNYVWRDRNASALQDDATSDGLNGVVVQLFEEDGTPAGSTVTADDPYGRPGFYLFDDLAPGRYYLTFVRPAGAAFVTPGGPGADPLDSDPAQATGTTEVFELVAGQYDTTRDAGLTMPAGSLRLGDRVWHDHDADGVFEPLDGELGIDGVRLNLYRDLNGSGQIDSGEFFATTTTRTELARPGFYRFDSLPAGAYLVQVDPSAFALGGPLASFTSSTGNDPAPDPDDDRDDDDNGLPLGPQGVLALPISLSAGGEPTSDGDGSSGNLTLDFGFFGRAAIGDRAFFDLDDDGLQDPGEPGVPGATVELYDDTATLLRTTTTDLDGRYGFADLDPGSYQLRFTPPTGFSIGRQNQGDEALDSDADQATGFTPPVPLTTGADLRWDVALVAPSAFVGDHVWVDDDMDGVQAPAETTGVAALEVRLYDALDRLVATDLTDSSGDYGFGPLMPGRYRLVFGTPPAGYAFSPQNQGADDQDSDADVTTGRTAWIDLAPGESDQSWDAGVFSFATIGDRVWNDRDADGVQESGEPGFGGATVRLMRPGQYTPVATTTTAGDGSYQFSHLVPGSYFLEFALPSGYRASPANSALADDAHDSDASPTTLQTTATTLVSGENDADWDFGIFPVAAIGDRVWHDLDADGVQDTGEGGVAGVQVILRDAGGAQVAALSTDATGSYRFGNLAPGGYSLEFVPPAPYLVSPPDSSAVDDAGDSDAAQSPPHVTVLTTLDAGEADLTWDLGLYQLAGLGNRVWHDFNGDGVQDAGEPGVPSATVTLFDGAGNQVGLPTLTDLTGIYTFTDLMPGDYSVDFALPAGFDAFSPQSSTADDAGDSDASPSAPHRTATLTLVSAQFDPDWDAGVMAYTALGDVVWDDLDGDGVQDSGEPPIESVTVTLFDADGNQVGAPAQTDSSGFYWFPNLLPGSYFVRFTDLPAGYTVTLPDAVAADESHDSDALRRIEFTGPPEAPVRVVVGQTPLVTLRSGEPNDRVDAGLFKMLSVGDRVWLDRDADGVQEPTEPDGVSGAHVTLLDDTGAVIDEQYTDPDGKYLFTDLLPGTYRVAFAELPSGAVVSPPDAASAVDTTDSDASPTAPHQTGLFALVAGADDLSRDMGLYVDARVGNLLWHDLDADGVQDTGEPGIAGATVELYREGGALVATDMTDSNGIYGFESVTPGRYYVKFIRPALYTDVSPRDATAATDLTDSDVDASGLTDVFTIVSGQDDQTHDAGLFQRVTLGDVVWLDSNGNGRQDGGAETGIGSVTVTLLDAGGNTLTSTSTNGSGIYSFANLLPGTYRLRFTRPGGYEFTRQDNAASGATDATDSDPNRTTGETIDITLVSGQNQLTWDAGLYQPASVGNQLWEDTNGNGRQDAAELAPPPGIVAGRTITLRGAGPNGTVGNGDDEVFTTPTGPDGTYGFSGLIPGTYRVEFGAAPANYRYTRQDQPPDDLGDSDVAANGRTGNFTLTSGANDQTRDAGIHQLLAVGNRVWVDADNDGAWDPGETGRSAVNVRLYFDANNDGVLDGTEATTPAAAAVTNADGYYLFTGRQPGRYLIEIDLPPGFVSSTGTNGSASGTSEPAPDPDLDADDRDDNGTAETTTVRTGFFDLAPGSEPTGEPDTGTIASPVRDENTNLTVDFGIFQPASVGRDVWVDQNADGLQGEAAYTGGQLRAELRQRGADDTACTPDDVVVASMLSDASGQYSFGFLAPGSYFLRYDLPPGYRLSPADRGGSDTLDSDPDVATRCTVEFSLAAGDSDTSRDVGLFRPVRLGNLVWNDRNNDGQSGGESGIDDVAVQLFHDTDGDGTLAGAETTPISTTTTVAGAYAFDGLTPGSYLVALPPSNFDPGGPLDGFVSSSGTNGSPTGLYEPAPDPDDNLDGNDNGSADASYGVISRAIVLWSGDEPAADGDDADGNQTLDFGLYRPAGVGDWLWEDADGDGLQAGEAAIGGGSVTLLDDGGAPVASQPIDASGAYHFGYLAPGSYRLRFTAPTGYAFTTWLAGDPAADSDVDPDTGDTDTFVLDPGQDDLDRDAGVYQLLALGNRVWDDQNNDGDHDGGEPGLDGQTVRLYYDADGSGAIDGAETTAVASQPTIGGGYYLFTDLLRGSYLVEVDPSGGYVSSSGQNASLSGPYEPAPPTASDGDDHGTTAGAVIRSALITLAPGAAPSDDDTLPVALPSPADDENADLSVDFGLWRPASVGDFVWRDLNGDGVQEAGEPPIDGVPVSLLDASGTTVISTTTTALDGSYRFVSLAAGDYRLAFATPAQHGISPAGASGAGVDSDLQSDGRTAVFTLISGQYDQTRDAGFWPHLSLGDTVWEDVDNDGARDDGEPLLGGWAVRLLDASGTTVLSSTATVDGLYRFDALAPGTYVVELVPQPGFASSTGSSDPAGYSVEPAPDPDDNANDVDDGSTAGGTMRSGPVTLIGGDETGDGDADPNHNASVDLGVIRPAAIGDVVWEDVDGDGVQESGEPGAQDVTVTLHTALGTLVASEPTLPDGSYLFDGLVPGDYVVTFSGLPAGSRFTRPDSALATDTTDSDANRTTGQTPAGLAPSGGLNDTLDAGVTEVVGLGDFVWEDMDADGVQEPGEPGVLGATVRLFDATTGLQVGADQPTLEDGYYEFVGLAPGRYFVVVTPPAGYVFTTPGATDDARDSDADPFSGVMPTTTVLSGQPQMTWDAGLYQRVAVGDLLWNDVDGDGAQGAGETGLDGVSVALLDAQGNELETTQTGPDGWYGFSDLTPGQYRLAFGPLPAGYIFTVPGGAAADADSDADPATGRTAAVELRSGHDDPTWDAGAFLPARLGDRVWDDRNNNNLQDADEQGMAGVPLTLLRGTAVISTTVTDGDGAYHFGQLPAGVYTVAVAPVAGYALSLPDGGADGVDSDFDRQTRQSAPVPLMPGDDLPSVDAGLHPLATVGNTVWLDLDLDGLHEPGEPGMAGLAVYLLNADGQIVAIARTGPDGSYVFADLEPGVYELVFEIPDGYFISPQDHGDDDGIDSDADPTTGSTGQFTLGPGEVDLTWFLGLSNSAPTVVRLQSFGAAPTAGGVRVEWVTAAEQGTSGFRLLRSADGTRAGAAEVTHALIVARGSGGGGASYSWVDTSALAGERYHYWLVEVGVDGRTAEHGPVAVQATASAGYVVFLPLVR